MFLNNTNLPKPLSTEEFEELIRDGSIEAKNRIIECNIRLVLQIVKEKFYGFPDKEEFVAIGIEGLIKATNTFGITKGKKFSTYATRCIQNEILMYLRKKRKHSDITSFEEMIEGTENNLTLETKLSDGIDFTEDIIEEDWKQKNIALLKKLINDLPDRERKILMLYFGFIDNKCHTQKEIAQMLGISGSYVSRIINRVLKQLKEKVLQYERKTQIMPIETQALKNKKGFIPKIEEEQKNMRELQTIYDLFKKYTKEQVDIAISLLSEKERETIFARYGNDLEHPVHTEISAELYQKFTDIILPKLINTLKCQTQTPTKSETIDMSIKKRRQHYNTLSTLTNLNITPDDLKILSPTEEQIMCMRLGLNGTKKMTQREIAETLKVSVPNISYHEKRAIKKLQSI